MLPRVILHNAVSADGRMDWLSVDMGQYYGLVSRWKEDATLVGAGTVLAAPDPVPPREDAPRAAARALMPAAAEATGFSAASPARPAAR